MLYTNARKITRKRDIIPVIMFEKKGSPVPVRLTESEKAQLGKIAETTGLSSSTIIRLLISSLVVHFRNNNNHLTLPIEWQRLVES